MRIRNARTFSFLGMGGRGNSPPQWDANFLLFYYLKNIFSIHFFMGYSLGGRVGDAFSNTPQMCGRGLLRSRFGGWAETQRWGGIREVGTFCGGTEQKHIWGNSKSHRRYEGGWLFIIIGDYAKKNFSHNLYYDIIAALSCILFVWVVGWGMRFRTPPKCADAVYCVRALGGGRKRRGGMAVCLKCRIASSANR